MHVSVRPNDSVTEELVNGGSTPLPPSLSHAVIYFIPVNEVTADLLEPDYGALAKLCE